jgi:hypothetical protein
MEARSPHVATSGELLEDSEGPKEKHAFVRYLRVWRQLEERHRWFGVTRPFALERHHSVMSHS